MAYNLNIINRFENPIHTGSLDKNDMNVGVGIVGAPACGDVMKLMIRVNPETNIIEEAKFKGFGCGSLIASAELVCEKLQQISVINASKISNKEIVEELCLPPVKIHCSVLAESAISYAIIDWKQKQLKIK